MSKKTILSENQVRQFMKYADIGGLADGFVNEMYTTDEELYEQEEEEDIEGLGDVDVGPEADVDVEPEADIEDIEGAEDAGVEESDVQSLVKAIADAIEGETGVAVNVEGAEGEGELEGELEGEEEFGETEAEFPMGDEEAVVADVEDDEEPLMETDKIATMVAERVQHRLKQLARGRKRAASRAAKIDSVADRILERISKGK